MSNYQANKFYNNLEEEGVDVEEYIRMNGEFDPDFDIVVDLYDDCEDEDEADDQYFDDWNEVGCWDELEHLDEVA